MKDIVKLTDLYQYFKIEIDGLIQSSLPLFAELISFKLSDIIPQDGTTFNIYGVVTFKMNVFMEGVDHPLICSITSNQLETITPIQLSQETKKLSINECPLSFEKTITDIRLVEIPNYLDDEITNYFLKTKPWRTIIQKKSQNAMILAPRKHNIKDIIITI